MKIAVVGFSGRVGQEVINLIQSSDHQFTAGWESQGQKMMTDAKPISNVSVWNPKFIDIVIDFSLPENFPNVFKWCQENKKPLVSGVTGLGEINKKKLAEILGHDFKFEAPMFWASNMSIGIALLKQFIGMTKVFKPKKISISETHHIHKKDSPSGTAISLATKAKQALNYKEDISIEAKRREEVFGIHSVRFESDDEVIEIYHEAMNRRVFASGSLKVAEWLVQKMEPQIYSMEDFIQDFNKDIQTNNNN